MEHRWSLRKPYQRPVLLSSPQHGLVSVRSRDISLGGMYVETGALTLPLNTLVSVEFSLDDSLLREFQLPALVVRRTANGAGLMFTEAAEEVVTALHRALYEQPRISAAQPHVATPSPLYTDAGEAE